jgi:hypothetical protein
VFFCLPFGGTEALVDEENHVIEFLSCQTAGVLHIGNRDVAPHSHVSSHAVLFSSSENCTAQEQLS